MVRCRAMVVVLLMVTWYGGGGATTTAAQPPAPRSSESREAVRLIVRPQVGDTLHLQMEQTIEMRGRRATGPEGLTVPRVPQGRPRTALVPV